MASLISIGGKVIGVGASVFVIGEIGINHNGDMSITKKLIDMAKVAGCDAVKFQKRTIPIVYSKEELEKPREVPEIILSTAVKRRRVLPQTCITRLVKSGFMQTTNGDLKYALEFTFGEYKEIDRYCKERGVLWFASPWDEESVNFLERFNVPFYKIASASLTDDGLLRHIKKTKKPVILSTGMSTMEEITRAVSILGTGNLVLLHTVSTYPSEYGDINLSVIKTLQKKFPGVPIGYSGHEKGISITLAAVAMGACVVERHITLDRTMWGSDQSASLEPHALSMLVRDIRLFERARGDGVKRVAKGELPIKEKLRRK
ncbi:MAG: N-acetylneuraminate synthase family protein [Parcubacteria group bacterium]|nr:N-acetylneuraminate synthase family protein [Parcubacteria group bacterium]